MLRTAVHPAIEWWLQIEWVWCSSALLVVFKDNKIISKDHLFTNTRRLIGKNGLPRHDVSGCHHVPTHIVGLFYGVQHVLWMVLRCWLFHVGTHFEFFIVFCSLCEIARKCVAELVSFDSRNLTTDGAVKENLLTSWANCKAENIFPSKANRCSSSMQDYERWPKFS